MSAERIFSEAFGPAALVRHSRSHSPFVREPASGQVAEEATVRFPGSSVELRWTRSDGTLLEFAEAMGLVPEYGSRNGRCGSRSMRVERGSVIHTTVPDAGVEPGRALICCAAPAASSDGPSQIEPSS